MKKIKSYTGIWNVEKVLYAINDFNLPFPVNAVKENIKDMPTQTAYAVYSAKEKAKSSVSDFKRGMPLLSVLPGNPEPAVHIPYSLLPAQQ